MEIVAKDNEFPTIPPYVEELKKTPRFEMLAFAKKYGLAFGEAFEQQKIALNNGYNQRLFGRFVVRTKGEQPINTSFNSLWINEESATKEKLIEDSYVAYNVYEFQSGNIVIRVDDADGGYVSDGDRFDTALAKAIYKITRCAANDKNISYIEVPSDYIDGLEEFINDEWDWCTNHCNY